MKLKMDAMQLAAYRKAMMPLRDEKWEEIKEDLRKYPETTDDEGE
jgi:hypothetical protein